MNNRKHSVGTFIRITLPDGSFAYGRLIVLPSYIAFYNYRTTSPDSDLDRISANPILFRVGVRQIALGAWDLIGCRALEEELKKPVVQFMQDIGDFRRCIIFDTAGFERDAEPQECVGLERTAAWEKNGVEMRLLDAFLVRPNAEVERLKVRLS